MLLAALLLIPISAALRWFHAPELLTFAAAALAIVPLAEWMRRATEQIALRAGSVIGGLLNVTFGNIAELVLALVVLRSGNLSVVKASITGSIVGNSLLGLGMGILAGSWGRAKQTFGRAQAGLLSSLLLLSLIALSVPAVFHFTERGLLGETRERTELLDSRLSVGVSVVLIALYFANLVYTLITHRDVFALEDVEAEAGTRQWSLKHAVFVLVAATAAVAFEAEIISGALEAAALSLGLTTFFVGVIVLPIVGNAAEYFSAVYFARKGHIGLVVGISVGASIQVALLTAPLLVLFSHALGHPMTLVFENPLELFALAGVAFVVNSISQDGETTWFEGALLLAVYALLGMAFFFASSGLMTGH